MQVVQVAVVLAQTTLNEELEVLEIPLQQLHLKVLTVVQEARRMTERAQAVAEAVAEKAAVQAAVVIVVVWAVAVALEP